MLGLEQLIDPAWSILAETILLLVFYKRKIAVLEILGDDVADKTSEVATAITVVQDALELSTPFFIDQLQIVVRLIDQLPFQLV